MILSCYKEKTVSASNIFFDHFYEKIPNIKFYIKLKPIHDIIYTLFWKLTKNTLPLTAYLQC